MQVLRKIAYPFSLVYGLVVYLRNLCFDVGILTSRNFKTPTVCIGNLSTGGTGKTPMIEWILRNLKGSRKTAVLSRGYKRRSNGFLLVEPNLSPEETGDEPLQIARKFTDATVAVDRDRRRGIHRLEEEVRPELILLDDAFQHRRVSAQLNLLLTSYDNLYVDDWYLPTGNLRDHKGQAKRAHVIIVTKCPPELSAEGQEQVLRKIRPTPEQRVLFSYLEYGEEVRGLEDSLKLPELVTREVLLVTAIADPGPLLKKLSQKGVSYKHRNFPDHHYFTEKELGEFNAAEMVLTTEKDFIRMGGRVGQAFYLPVEHKFLNEGKAQLTSMLLGL